jgi:hypothetical protein
MYVKTRKIGCYFNVCKKQIIYSMFEVKKEKKKEGKTVQEPKLLLVPE